MLTIQMHRFSFHKMIECNVQDVGEDSNRQQLRDISQIALKETKSDKIFIHDRL